jgi:hypothetical protein
MSIELANGARGEGADQARREKGQNSTQPWLLSENFKKRISLFPLRPCPTRRH